MEIVKQLLQSGALPCISNHKGEIPADLTTNKDILSLLSEQSSGSTVKSQSPQSHDSSFAVPFVPNYLRNAPFPYYDITNQTATIVDPKKTLPPTTGDPLVLCDADQPLPDTSDNTKMKSPSDEPVAKPTVTLSSPFVVKVWIDDALLSKYNKDSVEIQVKVLSEKEETVPSTVLSPNTPTSSPFFIKARIAKDESFSKSSATCSNSEKDFVEVDLDELTYQGLLKACCEELKVSVDKVKKIRKLPNVHITKDSDVQRLIKGQELELEITPFVFPVSVSVPSSLPPQRRTRLE